MFMETYAPYRCHSARPLRHFAKAENTTCAGPGKLRTLTSNLFRTGYYLVRNGKSIAVSFPGVIFQLMIARPQQRRKRERESLRET